MKTPSGRVRLLPFRCEPRHKLKIFAATDEWLVHLSEPGHREGLGQRMWIERRRVDAIRAAEGLRLGRCNRNENQRDRKNEDPAAAHRYTARKNFEETFFTVSKASVGTNACW